MAQLSSIRDLALAFIVLCPPRRAVSLLLTVTKWLLLFQRPMHSEGRKKGAAPCLLGKDVCEISWRFPLCVTGKKVWEGEGRGSPSPSKQGSSHQPPTSLGTLDFQEQGPRTTSSQSSAVSPSLESWAPPPQAASKH